MLLIEIKGISYEARIQYLFSLRCSYRLADVFTSNSCKLFAYHQHQWFGQCHEESDQQPLPRRFSGNAYGDSWLRLEFFQMDW